MRLKPNGFDEHAFRKLIAGETRGAGAALVRLSLNLPAAGYDLAVRLRGVAFDRGWRAVHRASVPVVSIGNLTLGGTGKTPFVEYTAARLRRLGVRVAILSRGYGADRGVNDEALVLEQNLDDVPHLQDKDRARIASIAVEELDSQALVLDDGFQHRRLARDLDIVLLDALDPFGLDRPFPRGTLREPVSGLKRAHIIVLSKCDLIDRSGRDRVFARVERFLPDLADRWVEARHAPIDVRDCDSASEPLDSLQGRRVAAFCGIGAPASFQATLASLGVSVVSFRAFGDHHPYSAADVSDLASWARSQRADLALTTQKDLVKLRVRRLGDVPLRAVRIGVEIASGESIVDRALDQIAATALGDPSST
jgi:tetraacyldisaccharide 4'-kinase